MSRRPAAPGTQLGFAIQLRRADHTLRDVGEEIGVANNTLSRLERGTHKPSAETALRLARWLGWSVERVLEAAKQPAPMESR